MGYRILAIHNNSNLSELLENSVRAGGYDLSAVRSASRGVEAVAKNPPDMILIDLALPDIDGLMCLKLLRETKEAQELPIILLCEKYSDEGMAQALDLGADDYICYTNCEQREFTARLRVAARRRLERDDHVGAELSAGPVHLDPLRHVCRVRRTVKVLRPREFELLEILLRKAGRVLSRAYLLESVWGMSRQADTRTVDVTVSRLRAALGRRAGRWVETVERFGYRFRSPE